MSEKPKILILGGCGFVGRHLVDFLVTNSLASEIRVVDKTPPQMAWLNKHQSEIFQNKLIDFRSANLINSQSCSAAFERSLSTDNDSWDIVINCAAETRSNQTDPVYQEGILKLSKNCAQECVKHKVKRFIELSSGNMNSNEKTPQKENCSIEPWTMVAKYKAKVEKELRLIDGLNCTILRLPIVYGIGDRRGLTPRIVIAALYRHLNEKMKLLWTASMKLNTVHISDVVAATWELANNPKAINETFNIVDDSESTQGTITDILVDIFNIKVDYWGLVMSNLTKIDMSGAVEEINDKHMGPWAEICQRDQIENTPLTPYMDEEILYHKHLHLDNAKLKSFGYQLRVPIMARELIEEIIRDFVREKQLPQSLGI